MKAHQWQNQSLWYQRKRDKSTWYYAARGARKTLHRIWGIWSNPVNADGRKEVEIATRIPVQTASKLEVGYSQVGRQENALIEEGNLCMEQLQKQRDQRALSNSNSSGQLVQGATPRTEFRNVQYTNRQYITKIFQFLQKKLGITAGYSTFTMEALNTHVLIWGMFMSSSMKAAIHHGPNLFVEFGDLQEHKIRGD